MRDILDLIRNDLRMLRDQGYIVRIVAHSFGAYLIYRLLRRDRFLIINRLILCGAVIQRRARWVDVKYFDKQVKNEIVNLCGLRDPFPVLAKLACRRLCHWRYRRRRSIDRRSLLSNWSQWILLDEFYNKYFEPAIFGKTVASSKSEGYPRHVGICCTYALIRQLPNFY